MPRLVNFNRYIIPADSAHISAFSNAALYGKGTFTTIALYNSKPFLWEKHWRRLSATADKLKIDISSLSEELLKDSLLKTVDANKIRHGRARLTIFDESPSRVWQAEIKQKTSFFIQTADPRVPGDDLRLIVSAWALNSKSPLAGLKTCNYLENILALEEAKSKGFDEAVRLNERNEIVSAAIANLFWVKDCRLFAPALETGALSGTTREFIMENFAVTEKKAGLSALFAADAVFLTSAGIGVSPVKSLNEHRFSSHNETVIRVRDFLQSFSKI